MLGLRRMRPRFTFTVPCPPGQALRRLEVCLEAPDASCIGRTYPKHKHALLKIHPADQHFWSPQLSLDFEPQPEGGTLVRGLLGPHPSVWSLFMCAYAVIAFTSLGVGMYGYATWTLGQGTDALWLLPGALVLTAVVYAFALLGQHLGYDQMVLLRETVEEAVDGEPVGAGANGLAAPSPKAAAMP